MTDNERELFRVWRDDEQFDEQTRAELAKLDEEADEKEISDRFRCDLTFGTGGLRGVMGAGTNRMNRYTVGKATLGLARYLLKTYGDETCATRGAVIDFDTRNNSAAFANVAAAILSQAGIRVRLFKAPRPTPQLSFAVRHFGALAGIVITASHNPKEYNGYKVYDAEGCQIGPAEADAVFEEIQKCKESELIFEFNQPLVEFVDVTAPYLRSVHKQVRFKGFGTHRAKKALKIVYTPLHGTGYLPVTAILKKDGFTNVLCVPEQTAADGSFPTVVSPNPEDRRALTYGIQLAQKEGADLVLGTDPDCDRVGIAVRDEAGSYMLMTGNQTGALLMDYIVQSTDLTKYTKPAVVKTIVTSELGAEIARKAGVTVFSTLTGFKYIGEKIGQFATAGAENNRIQDYDFLFGYEESYGYLAGTHARDKDAVVASMLICEMAAAYKTKGKSLLQRLEEIYQEFGYYRDALDSFTLPGAEGMEKIRSFMEKTRQCGSPFPDTRVTEDYADGFPAEEGFGKLPAADVLRFLLKDGSWVAVRPSGTEPKIKFYYNIRATDRATAEVRLQELRDAIYQASGWRINE